MRVGIRPVEESSWAFSVGKCELGHPDKGRLDVLAAMSRKERLGQTGAGPECQAREGKEETKIITSLLCTSFFHVRRVV